MKKNILLILFTISISTLNAQVGINNIDPKATLDIAGNSSQVNSPDGIIAPRITRDQLIAKTAYGINQTGAIIYVTNLSGTPNPATVKVTSIGYYYFNGTNWENLSFSSAKSFTETITLTATNTNPTKATTREQDYINLVDDGSGWCTVTMQYFASSPAGASVGNGNYLFKLPAGYSFDTSVHQLNPETGVAINGWNNVARIIPGSIGRLSMSGYSQVASAMPHSDTTFKLAGFTGESGSLSMFHYLSNGYFGNTVASTQYSISFRFKKR